MLNRYRFERVKGVTFLAFLYQWDIKCFTWSSFAVMTVWQSAQQPKVFLFFLSITQMQTLALCTQAVMHCRSSSVPEKFPTPSLQSTRGKTHRVYMHRAQSCKKAGGRDARGCRVVSCSGHTSSRCSVVMLPVGLGEEVVACAMLDIF